MQSLYNNYAHIILCTVGLEIFVVEIFVVSRFDVLREYIFLEDLENRSTCV